MTDRADADLLAKDKLVGIELLRFLTAMAVLFWHYQQFWFIKDTPVNYDRAATPFYALFWPFFEHGYFGVQVFWCISGFIFYLKYAHAIASKRETPRAFVVARFSRLYPLHFATLLTVALLQHYYYAWRGCFFVYQPNDLQHFVLQLFMASDWSPFSVWSYNGVIWSISIEVLVYALFFVTCRYVGISPKVPAVIVLLVSAAKLLGRYPIHTCITYFYLGCLTAYLYAWSRRAPPALDRAVGIAAAAVPALGVVLGLKGELGPSLVTASLAPALVYLTSRYLRPRKGPSSTVLVALGNVTYSSYLLHFPLQLLTILSAAALGITLHPGTHAFFVGYVGCVIGVSLACYRFFEVPAQRYLRRRAGAARPAPVPARVG